MISENVSYAWRPRELLQKGFRPAFADLPTPAEAGASRRRERLRAGRSKASQASLTGVPLYLKIFLQRTRVLQRVKGEGNWLS